MRIFKFMTPEIIFGNGVLSQFGESLLRLGAKKEAAAPACEVIIMTGYSTVKTAVEAIQAGARDYMEKPFDDLDGLEKIIRSVLNHPFVNEQELNAEAARYGIIYSSRGPMSKVISAAAKLAKKAINILLEGETGTGKELVARFIHGSSLRAQHPFVSLNCGAVPETLLESELFGHEKGAFTGAFKTRRGVFELANRGTLFLDEIGEAPPSIQVKLLRVLETGEFMRVGSEEIVKSNVRIISATNRNLEAEVEANHFRADLLYRLEGVKLTLPPLRERPDDIPLIAAYYLRKKYGESYRLSPDAEDLLKAYSWPGNVRQLLNVLNQTVAIHDCRVIQPEHLPAKITERGPLSPSIPSGSSFEAAIEREARHFVDAILEKTAHLEQIDFRRLMERIKKLEAEIGKRIIEQRLAQTGGDRAQLSRQLNITPRILRYYLNEKDKEK